ncbi:hypothetical protein Btru_055038 [Bulinus truncatus]|nr:hypothetical protein Btru_055038 [Bulinus truncatus]
MKQAIWVGFLHSSNDDNHAMKTVQMKAMIRVSVIPKHTSHTSTHLNPTVAECVKEVYAFMGKPKMSMSASTHSFGPGVLNTFLFRDLD